MNILENYGAIMLLRHEGNQQFASALAGSVQALPDLIIAPRPHPRPDRTPPARPTRSPRPRRRCLTGQDVPG